MAPIKRLLIANRGEIVVRIARTAHRLGIDTVGVYSEPDANALHVDSVDTAVAIGGAAPADSYLRGDAIIQAALDTGADAIHPGYGFLAESAPFAQQVIDAGLTWVGPTPDQIAMLGDKVEAKKMAEAANVPTTSITEVAAGDAPTGVAMPALVKAAAGGGGRGMRIVRSADELAEAIERASAEAASAFGDGTVFIEPYIENGRHIEVQIMGDAHGSVVHLGERECSIQRRNQKVVEESPSAGISDEVRQALHAGALALANHVGYQNAGTVEFLVGDDGTINFLEVNTRLQVEHPVTEAVTGLDLVELQLRSAAGEPLPVGQDDIHVDGHAIEVRVVAEDPAAGWLPSTGTVRAFAIGDHVRVDTGFRSGSNVPADYDSLLAKVIAHAPTRTEAAGALARALRNSQIVGVQTNLDTLAAILAESDFLDAKTPTSYLDAHPEVLSAGGPVGDDQLAHFLAAVFGTEARERGSSPLAFAPSGWRNIRTTGQRQTWLLGDTEHSVEYTMCDDNAVALIGAIPVPDSEGLLPDESRRRADIRILDRTEDRIAIEIDGRRRAIDIAVDGGAVHTSSSAGSLSWHRKPRFVDHEADRAGGGPVCPLPGVVLSVMVEQGQTVADGDTLMVVEAMKMEHKITASGDSVVTEVYFAAGDRVDTGDLLVGLEAVGDDAEST